MSKRWINTKVEFKWDENLQKYVEILSDGYWYKGDMALCADQAPGAAGGSGGAGVTSEATTRLHVIDPHLVIMMRDVMDDAATAARLTVCSGASGGGGGGGGAGLLDGDPGVSGSTGTPASNCILPHSGSKGGDGGNGGNDGSGGGGGGGAGGNGGVFVLITTTTGANTGSIILNGGKGGAGGENGTGPWSGESGQPGASGSFMHIRV